MQFVLKSFEFCGKFVNPFDNHVAKVERFGQYTGIHIFLVLFNYFMFGFLQKTHLTTEIFDRLQSVIWKEAYQFPKIK